MNLASITSMLERIFNWILKFFGKKIADVNDYQIEIFKIQHDYVEKSPACAKEKEQGATFRFSEYDTPGYERYFEISGNQKKYFWNDSKQYLQIQRVKK